MSTTLQRAAALAIVISAGAAVGALAQADSPDPHHPGTITEPPPDEPVGAAEQPQGVAPDGSGVMSQGMAGGMMSPDMMAQMMVEQGLMQPGRTRAAPGMHGHMMKVVFAIADADGDGGISFEEISTIQRRIFDVVDADQDGRVTTEELQGFMQG